MRRTCVILQDNMIIIQALHFMMPKYKQIKVTSMKDIHPIILL